MAGVVDLTGDDKPGPQAMVKHRPEILRVPDWITATGKPLFGQEAARAKAASKPTGHILGRVRTLD